MIKFEHVTKTFEGAAGDTDALKDLSLNIEKGEFVFIVGKSGAGKSTLTKLLIGELRPTSGDVYINGICVNHLKHKEIPFLRRKIGMVFQDFRLLENKNVYENVAFALEIVGASKRTIRRKVPEALSRVGLASKAKNLPSQLSGGEQQRVAIARAVVNNPGLVIADEPTGNLDPANSAEILDMLIDINKSGTTVLVVTHDRELVDKLQKRVILIDKGVVASDEERSTYNEVQFFQ